MPLFRCGIDSPPPLSTWAGKTSRNICKSVREEFPFPAWACECGCTHLHTCCLWWNMSLLLAARGLGERAWGDCKLGWLWSSPSPTHSATRSPTHSYLGPAITSPRLGYSALNAKGYKQKTLPPAPPFAADSPTRHLLFNAQLAHCSHAAASPRLSVPVCSSLASQARR